MSPLRTYRIDGGGSFHAPSHRAAHAELCALLRVDGPRTLVAWDEDGAELRASVYDGEDYIMDAKGRRFTSW